MALWENSKKPVESLLKEMDVSTFGLSQKEALARLQRHGPNSISEEGLTGWRIFLRQFKSSFVYLLVAAALLAYFLGETIDAGMIILFVTINLLLGFYQEYHSERSLRLLKKFLSPRARAWRDGESRDILAEALVPGDVIDLAPGDMIPADVRFIRVHDLAIDESVLTGESVPVRKVSSALKKIPTDVYGAANLGFAGSTVVEGGALALVLATGSQRMVGDIAALTADVSRTSSFEKGINRFGTFVLRVIFVTLFFVFLSHLLIKGGGVNLGELALFAIALAVSVIPEALPVVTTFALSRGAVHLAKNKVVVKRLSAVEDLGSIEVLCTDKTGTLTENKLTVAEVYGAKPKDVLFFAGIGSVFVTDKNRQHSNPFDLAIWNKLDHPQQREISQAGHLAQIPFDPVRRINTAIVSTGKQITMVCRGAPENIMAICAGLPDKKKKEVLAWMAGQGLRGRRVLAVARKNVSGQGGQEDWRSEEIDLTFVGLVAFLDPIKASTADAVRRAGELGVKIKILTGDSPEVAGAVAHQIGLIPNVGEVITGSQLYAMSVASQHEAVLKYNVFARVSPREKYKIIELLEENHEVGFLGEGINDAPALKIANVALVVSGAADIAREAADIVLLNKGLNVIVDGIKEGRQVFANVIKYIRATLGSNFGNFYTVAIASLLVDFLPLLPLQLLLINLLTDFPMISIATDTVDTGDLKKPSRYDIREIALSATLLGVVSTIFDFMFFALYVRISPEVLQTNWFIGSVLTELLLLFSIRTRGVFFKAKKPSALLLSLTALSFAAAIIIPSTIWGREFFHFVNPTRSHMTAILLIAVSYFVVTETVKLFYYKFVNHQKPA